MTTINEITTDLPTTESSSHPQPFQRVITTADLRNEVNYYKAQRIVERMLTDELISIEEFKKLSRINRDTFAPFLAEIMSDIP